MVRRKKSKRIVKASFVVGLPVSKINKIVGTTAKGKGNVSAFVQLTASRIARLPVSAIAKLSKSAITNLAVSAVSRMARVAGSQQLTLPASSVILLASKSPRLFEGSSTPVTIRGSASSVVGAVSNIGENLRKISLTGKSPAQTKKSAKKK